MKLDPKDNMYYTLKEMGVRMLVEFQFDLKRRFRFDFALPDHRIAIEYEGIFGGGKSRHTTVTGYTKDTEKYNLAAVNGWRVLRYTAKNYQNMRADLMEVLK